MHTIIYSVSCAVTPGAWLTVGAGVGFFLGVTLLLVLVLLFAKKKLVQSGDVTITMNGDEKLTTAAGKSLLSTMADNNIFLSSACGGKGSCGQCRLQVEKGGGEALPTEAVHFTRRELKNNWRLACQVKVKNDMDYAKDIDRDLIGPAYLPAWEKFGLFDLKCRNTETTVRAYSMANYPAEGDRIMLTVRIATPPMKPKPEVGFMEVMPGIASSYIFSLKPGDKVMMSGPYGDFHPIFSKAEMMWIGGGAGMAPLRAQIMHMTKTLKTTDRKMNYFYGARALNEVFYLDDFLKLEKEYPNFKFHLALDRPDPAADAAGVAYTPGFVHQVIYNNYLKDHDSPEDIEYYMCGPGPMSKAVENMLDGLGVAPESIHYDNFGG